MKKITTYSSNLSLRAGRAKGLGLNQKWPAQNERTIQNNLTIGLKNYIPSFKGKEILI